MTNLRSVGLLAACVVLASLAARATQENESVEPAESIEARLNGTWLRDERESDDARVKIREAATAASRGSGVTWGPGGGFGTGGRSGSGGMGGAGGTGGPGGWGGRGGRKGRGAGSRGGSPEERLETLVYGLDVLRIEQRGDLLEIVDANRATRLVYTDGRRTTDGFGSETTAGLRADGVVIVTLSERGQRSDTYQVVGDRLVVTTDIQGAGSTLDLTLRSVYERAGAASSKADVAQDKESTAETAQGRAQTTEPQAVVETARVVESDGPWTPLPTMRPTHRPPEASPDGDVGEPPAPSFVGGSVIRALPPEAVPGELLRGKVEIQTLTIDPAVATVEFWLDDERVDRRKLPPFETKVTLADPPREQRVRVVAYDLGDQRLGEDEIVLNRLDPPFRVRLVALEGDRSSGSVTARAEVSVPRKAELRSVSFYRDEEQVAVVERAPFVAEIPTAGAGSESFVRVVATLHDGRELEDVNLLVGGDFHEEIDVHLVQLQVLVTDRSGTPVPGLEAKDFKVVDGGRERQIERLYPSRDVALVLGLAVDSSGSMGRLWGETQGAAEEFLDTALGARDRAFIVDFDDRLRLLQPLTGDRSALYAALGRLRPQGGTALYDSVLFSLLQYHGEPGRRALVVLTDGFDSGSRSDPNRAVEFGQRLGVPVYAIAMNGPGGGMPPPATGSIGAPGAGGGSAAGGAWAARANLRLITDPTGGRLFQIGLPEQVASAFGQIENELRNQYVLMYYTDSVPEARSTPVVEVEGKGLRVKTAIPLDLAD